MLALGEQRDDYFGSGRRAQTVLVIILLCDLIVLVLIVMIGLPIWHEALLVEFG